MLYIYSVLQVQEVGSKLATVIIVGESKTTPTSSESLPTNLETPPTRPVDPPDQSTTPPTSDSAPVTKGQSTKQNEFRDRNASVIQIEGYDI